MPSVNQEQIVGSFIPDVYIRRVSLETAGVEIRETNPHIEHSREFHTVYNKTTDKSMRVTLDLLLKEKLENNLIDTWFSNQEFQKYLQFTVIQSTDPLVTKLLSTSNNAIQIANSNSFIDAAVFLSELMEELKDLPEFSSIGGKPPAYSENDIPEILWLISEHTKVKKISVLEHMLNNKSVLNQQYKSTTDQGVDVYDFVFRTTFELSTNSPNHLTYFAVSSIDIDKLIDDYNLDTTDSHLFEIMNGKVAADMIIKNSKLVTKSFVYKDEEDNVWTGPTHLSNGVWLTGTPTSGDKSPLRRMTVQNNKIQDFRIYEKLERLQLDFSVVENKLFNRNISFGRTTNDNMDVPRVQNYFSEAAMTVDSVGQCRFAFAMDYGKMLRDYTKYGALYSKDNLQEIFNNVRIKNFNIIRRRVTDNTTELNRLGNPVNKRKIFSDEDMVDTICRTGESSPGNLNTIDTKSGALREIRLELDSEFDELRHFMGTDFSMPTITDGYYQYGVEVEVEDHTSQYILKKIKDLGRAKYNIDSYMALASMPENYDLLTNKFTQTFIDKMNAEYGFEKGKKPLIRSPWVGPLITYFSVLAFFRKSPVDPSLVPALWRYVDPRSGNPRGIGMVAKLIENLMSRLASAVGTNLVSKRSKGMRTDATGNYVAAPAVLTPGKPRLKTFKVEHYFPQVFDSNLPKNVGYDFLSRGKLEKENNRNGLRIVSSDEYEKRTELESLKYYNKLTSDISMRLGESVFYTENDSISKTQLTYLTPSNVNLGDKGNISLLTSPFDSEKCLTIQATIAGMNLNRKSPFIPFVPPVASPDGQVQTLTQAATENKSKLIDIMSKYNCTLVSRRSKKTRNQKSERVLDYDPYTDVGNMMGEDYMSVDDIIIPASDTDSDQKSENEINTDPTQFFAGMAFPLFYSGFMMSSVFSKPHVIDRPDQVTKKKYGSYYNMEKYDLESPFGFVTMFTSPLVFGEAESAISPSQTKDYISPKVKQQMSLLPNQIKSLFLGKLDKSNEVLRFNWSGGKSSLIQSPVGRSAFDLNYKLIRKTEVLVGYKIDQDGNPLLKHPIWQPLTFDILRNKSGTDLLCRLVKYSNRMVGSHSPVAMRMPVYNKYFIIRSPSRQGSDILRRGRTLYRDKISRRLSRTLREHRFLSEEYLSTVTVSSKRITPKRDKKSKVLKKVNLAKNLKLSKAGKKVT